jgi:hypothetical protein
VFRLSFSANHIIAARGSIRKVKHFFSIAGYAVEMPDDVKPRNAEHGPAGGRVPGRAELGREFSLAPVDCRSREEIERQLWGRQEPKLPLADSEKEEIRRRQRPRPRFALWELIAVTTAVAVGLSGAMWMPAAVFAGAAGLVMLATIVWIILRPPQSRAMNLVWGLVVLIYVLAAAGAVWRSGE